MNSTDEHKTYIYIIDKDDIILRVNEKLWDIFYLNNNEINSFIPSNIVGSSLWNYISGVETKHLYKIIIENVRKYKKSITLPFRCDSEIEKRFLELTIIPLENNSVKFESKIISTEKREPVELFNVNRNTSDDFIKVCSMCKKIYITNSLWVEAEVAVELMKLFHQKVLPQLTHSYCPSCYKLAKEKINDFL